MKIMNHTIAGCEVCTKHIKPLTLEDESGSGQNLSIPQDKILKKINLPEVKNDGLTCQSCHCSPIIGNTFLCFTCKDFISCESCYDAKKHDHALNYVPSKFERL